MDWILTLISVSLISLYCWCWRNQSQWRKRPILLDISNILRLGLQFYILLFYCAVLDRSDAVRREFPGKCYAPNHLRSWSGLHRRSKFDRYQPNYERQIFARAFRECENFAIVKGSREKFGLPWYARIVLWRKTATPAYYVLILI